MYISQTAFPCAVLTFACFCSAKPRWNLWLTTCREIRLWCVRGCLQTEFWIFLYFYPTLNKILCHKPIVQCLFNPSLVVPLFDQAQTDTDRGPLLQGETIQKAPAFLCGLHKTLAVLSVLLCPGGPPEGLHRAAQTAFHSYMLKVCVGFTRERGAVMWCVLLFPVGGDSTCDFPSCDD